MNYPSCTIVSDGIRSVVVAVSSGRPDDLMGCHWTMHLADGRLVGSGFSGGYRLSGLGSAITAMKLGRAAARRYLKRKRKAEGVNVLKIRR